MLVFLVCQYGGSWILACQAGGSQVLTRVHMLCRILVQCIILRDCFCGGGLVLYVGAYSFCPVVNGCYISAHISSVQSTSQKYTARPGKLV